MRSQVIVLLQPEFGSVTISVIVIPPEVPDVRLIGPMVVCAALFGDMFTAGSLHDQRYVRLEMPELFKALKLAV